MSENRQHSIERSLVQSRLAALDAERDAGVKLLSDLESRVSTLRGQLLRIDGARQALMELLGPPDRIDSTGPAQARHPSQATPD